MPVGLYDQVLGVKLMTVGLAYESFLGIAKERSGYLALLKV